MRWLVGIAFVVLMLSPASAGADRQIATTRAFDLQADGGWLSFDTRSGPILAGPLRRFAPVTGASHDLQLGTDRRGRAMGLYRSCTRSSCELVQRVMATGRTRTLLRYSGRLSVAPDVRRGVVATAQYSDGRHGPTRITVRRPGRRTLAWNEQAHVNELHLTGRHLVYVSSVAGDDPRAVDDQLRAVDIAGRRPRARTLVVDPNSDEEARCECDADDTARTLSSPSADGRYAYWVEQRINVFRVAPVEGSTTRLLRADLTKRRQVNEVVELKRHAREAAVDRGRIFYTSVDPPEHVFELTRPQWRQAGRGPRVLVPPGE